MALIGTLAELGLEHTLMTLAQGKKTGRLKVTAPDGREAFCFFLDGVILHAACGTYLGDEAVVALFGWDDGQMAFVSNVPLLPRNVMRGLDHLVAMGVSAGHILREEEGAQDSERSIFQWADHPQPNARCVVDSDAWKLLRLLDGVRTVGEVIRMSGIHRVEALSILHELGSAGFIERVESVKTLTARKSPPFAGFSILAPTTPRDPVVELDEGLRGAWIRVRRFSRGIERIRVKSPRGRILNSRVTFRAGLDGAVVLPEEAFDRLVIAEGEKVQVRPIGSRVRAPRA